MQTRTFLFADLRDYTKFVEHHGDAAAATLIGDYRRLVRAEVARHAGAEVKTEGDSFYVVFTSAHAALRCAIAILREAERYSIERSDRPMRIGVGVHSGEPQPHEGQFVGGAVIVAARLAQAARAGQLLTTEIVLGLLPGGAGPQVSEVESIELKGIERPPRVLAVGWRGAPAAATTGSNVVAVPAQPPESGAIEARELIGRETELGVLAALFDDAVRAKGRVVLIAGEAGLGKTALVRRFVERITGRGIVLVGECTEIEARRPFGPFVDAFASGGLPVPREFGAVGADDVGPVEWDQYRIHAAFADGLRASSANAPVVLVVEDVHWADEATRELIGYLPRRIQNVAVMVLATYRPDELHRRHPLNETLAALDRGRLASEIRLAPLGEDAVARLIASALRLERAPTRDFRRAIYERCGGNPFFVEEVLRSLVQRGDISYENGSWRRTRSITQLELPRTISAAVDQRLRQLAERSLRILRIAAVIGTRFDFELLAQVSAGTDDELIDALRAAVDAQLLTEERYDGGEHFRFRHALTREAVVSELLGRERRSLHARIAQAIEARAGVAVERYAEELAYHFDEARDAENTIVYRRIAAQQAARAAAYQRTQEHLDRAVELATRDRHDLPQLCLELATAARYAGDLRRAVAAAEAALSLAQQRGEEVIQATALMEISSAANHLGDPAKRDRSLARALALLEPLGTSPELARAHQLRALFLLLAGDPTAADVADQAVDMARAVGATEVLVRSLNYAGVARGVPDGIPLLRESFERARASGLVDAAGSALNNLIVILVDGGRDFSEIAEVRRERLEYARRTGLRSGEILDEEVSQALQQGDWDVALRVIDEGRGASLRAAGRALTEALLLVARGGPTAGLHLIGEPRAQLLGSGLPEWIATAARSACVRFVAGEMRGAIDDARPLLDLATFINRASESRIVALLAAAELGDARAFDAHARGLRQGPTSGGGEYLAARALADATISGGRDAARVLALYEEAAALAESSQRWIASTFIRLGRARLLASDGDFDAARREFERFLPYWRKAKATWYLGELEKKARSMGIELVTAGG